MRDALTHWYQMAPAMVMFTYGAIIECQSVEHVPLVHEYTFASELFAQAGVVAGCTGFEGLSCSTQPQLLSEHVALLLAHGGSHC